MFTPQTLFRFILMLFLCFAFPFFVAQAQRSASNIARKRFPSTPPPVSTERRKELHQAEKLKEKALQSAYLKKFDAAMRYAERALELKKIALGEDHPSLAGDMLVFGAIFEDAGQYARRRVVQTSSGD